MAQPAFDPLRETQEESEAASRRIVVAAQDAASRTGASVRRAGAYVQTSMAGVADRAQDLAHGANERIRGLTGRPVQAWPGAARSTVREHPLQALAATVGLGYLIGKILFRQRSDATTRTRKTTR